MVYRGISIALYAGIVQTLSMGRPKKTSTFEVMDGVFLKQSEGGIWHYNFTFNGKQFRKSTKMKDKSKAIHIAVVAHRDAEMKLHLGHVVEKIPFKKLSKKYLESLQGQSASKIKSHTEQIKRYLNEYFGQFDDIAKINNGTLNDYVIWRKSKSDNKVKNQTLNREKPVLNQMLRFASDYNWIEKGVQLKHLSEAGSRNRRSHFTVEQYRDLITTSRKRSREYADKKKYTAKQIGMHTDKHWKRNLLHNIILIIANTGMRVDEMKTATWKNVDWENNKIKLHIAGKTKSSRSLLVREYGMVALKRILKSRLSFLAKTEATFDENEQIMSLPNGKVIKSFKKGFRELLKEAGFKYKEDEKWHSLTSLRHTYATLRLTTKKGQKGSIIGISKQMGTSIAMIERHYGHDTVDDYTDELLG